MLTSRSASLLVLIASSGCTGTTQSISETQQVVSSGAIMVPASTLGFDQPLPDWEATVRAQHDFVLAFREGEAVIEYQMKVGAGSSDGSRAIGLQLQSSELSTFLPGEPIPLDPTGTAGYPSQIGARIGETHYRSHLGTVTIRTFEAGTITGEFETQLKPVEDPEADPIPFSGAFAGAMGMSCFFFDFDANDGTSVDLGPESEQCAMLFE